MVKLVTTFTPSEQIVEPQAPQIPMPNVVYPITRRQKLQAASFILGCAGLAALVLGVALLVFIMYASPSINAVLVPLSYFILGVCVVSGAGHLVCAVAGSLL